MIKAKLAAKPSQRPSCRNLLSTGKQTEVIWKPENDVYSITMIMNADVTIVRRCRFSYKATFIFDKRLYFAGDTIAFEAET